MESTKYLWLVTSELKPSKKFIYLNEEGDKIVGNSVSDSNIVSPYSSESIYTSSICVGIAKEFISSEDSKLNHTNEIS